MADIPDTVTASSSAEPIQGVITPQDVTADIIASKLPVEQREAFQKNRAAKKVRQAKAAAPAAAAEPAAPAAPEAKAAEPPAPAPDAETVVMGEDAAPEPKQPDPEPEPESLSEEELAKLDEKARKRVTEASKEAAKVRKRAQEAEARIKEIETELAEAKTKAEQVERSAAEHAVRAAGLAGNAFARFTESQQVAAWGVNAQEALVLLNAHEREVKAGKADEDQTVSHALPDGREIEITAEDRATLEARVKDAQAWFDHHEKLSTHRKSADKLAEKHTAVKGYSEARAALLKDPDLHARIEELATKAAWYDVLTARRAEITFRDTAGAAKSAPASKADAPKTAPKPPVESAASVPRLAKTDDADSDLKARKSALMQRAMNAKTDDERQRLLKEAIKLGSTALKRAAA